MHCAAEAYLADELGHFKVDHLPNRKEQECGDEETWGRASQSTCTRFEARAEPYLKVVVPSRSQGQLLS